MLTKPTIDSSPIPFERILQLASIALDVPVLAIAGFDLERHHFVASLGIDARQATFCVPLCAYAMAQEQVSAVPDLAADARFGALPVVTLDPGLRGYAGVPLHNPNGLTVGALWIGDLRPRQFDETQLRSLMLTAQLVEREMLLRSLARHDALTGLLNPSFSNEELEREWRRARRSGVEVSALLIDLDHFADFNEAYGRATGDAALRVVATALADRCRRASDLVMRQGGDRFLALLPDTSADHASILAERCRADIEALSLGNAAANHLLTASVGHATLSASDRNASVERLVEVAETAVAVAKDAGRNRVATSG